MINKRLSTLIQYLIFFLLGVFFVWLSLKNLNQENLQQIKRALRHARYWLIIPVLIVLVSAHLVRAIRWRLLIQPLEHAPAVSNTFFAVMIGYLVNQGVPRLGEVVKCTMLGRYEKIPVEKLIGTVILERVVDALSFLAVLAITLAIQPGIYSELMNSFFSHSVSGTEKRIPGYIFLIGVILLIAVLAVAWMIWKKKNFRDLLGLFVRIGKRMWEGISSIRHLKKRGLFIFLTITLWALYLFAGYIGLFALQETSGYGIKEAFTILSAGSIGMIASPGGIGAYAFLIQKTMPVYGMNEGIALAFGWILWLVTTAVIIIGGLISFALLPYYFKRKNNEAG